MPRVLQGKRIANLQGYETEKRRAVEAFEAGKSIFISGPCGTGKSHLAYGLVILWGQANQYLTEKEAELSLDAPGSWRFDRRSRFLPAVELFHELKRSFKDNPEISEDELITRYTVDDLLVLDDIGAEKISDWSRSVFYLLIDRRYREKRQTIYTSNLNLENISSMVDDRVASRLATCEVIELKGEDGKGADWRVNHSE